MVSYACMKVEQMNMQMQVDAVGGYIWYKKATIMVRFNGNQPLLLAFRAAAAWFAATLTQYLPIPS